MHVFWMYLLLFPQYETTEEAEATRSALHGTQWPASNPKTLRVDFSKEEQLKRFQISDESAPGETRTLFCALWRGLTYGSLLGGGSRRERNCDFVIKPSYHSFPLFFP